jgi:hypothetical protein
MYIYNFYFLVCEESIIYNNQAIVFKWLMSFQTLSKYLRYLALIYAREFFGLYYYCFFCYCKKANWKRMHREKTTLIVLCLSLGDGKQNKDLHCLGVG